MDEEQKPQSPTPKQDGPPVRQRRIEKEPKLKPGRKKWVAGDFNRKGSSRRSVRSPK